MPKEKTLLENLSNKTPRWKKRRWRIDDDLTSRFCNAIEKAFPKYEYKSLDSYLEVMTSELGFEPEAAKSVFQVQNSLDDWAKLEVRLEDKIGEFIL